MTRNFSISSSLRIVRMVSKVKFNNAGDIVIVQCNDTDDVVDFIHDLKANLDNFKLGSYEGTTITFTCTAINHSSNVKTDYNANFLVRPTDAVLIKNRRIVTTHCNELLMNNLITLE